MTRHSKSIFPENHQKIQANHQKTSRKHHFKNQEKPRKTVKTIGTSPKKQHQEEAQQDWDRNCGSMPHDLGNFGHWMMFRASFEVRLKVIARDLSHASWAPQVATGMTSLRPRLGSSHNFSPPHRFQRLWELRKFLSNLSINLQCPSIIQNVQCFPGNPVI